jgi:hypothetical protein
MLRWQEKKQVGAGCMAVIGMEMQNEDVPILAKCRNEQAAF